MSRKKKIDSLVGNDKLELLKQQLDIVFANYIRKRDKYTCVISGAQREITISHLFGKAEYPNVRWNEYNVHCMSKELHKKYHEADPFVYIDWFIDQYGDEALRALQTQAYKRTHVYTVGELIELTRQYVQKTQELPRCKAANGRIIK